MPHPQDIEDEAGRLYTVYCHAVGGKAYDGRPLPSWQEFSTDPGKQTQANGWRALAELVANDPRVESLQKRVAELEAGIKSVDDLMRDSYGVAGLHQNGDIAPWCELMEGGRYEEWLWQFNKAMKGGAR